MVLKKDGSVWVTGHNMYGQLGDGWTTANRYTFIQAISSGVTSIAAGAFHSMIFKQDGSIWATGWNKHGQLGDCSTASKKTFVKLAPFDNRA